MNRRGVGILAGSDAPTSKAVPGESLHEELAELVEAGLTPMQALQAATRSPAKFLGVLDSLGTVERGKVADLVLLDANPLLDIRNARLVNTVVLAGRLLRRSDLNAMLMKAGVPVREASETETTIAAGSPTLQ
jgi:imidazolonepropionase-like amidohydrolase